jgi:SAM-dependent methyltransferase
VPQPPPAPEEARPVFGNGTAHSRDQHRCLAAAYDPVTLPRLAAAGVGPGWRCLEIGAGGGSIARWLAQRVLPGGSVLATDRDLRDLVPGPGLEVAALDVARDPFPEAAYDLVVARLVLQHVPTRDAVLRTLVRSLKPGGLLQIDEIDASYEPPLLTPDPQSEALYVRFLHAKTAALRAAGGDAGGGADRPGRADAHRRTARPGPRAGAPAEPHPQPAGPAPGTGHDRRRTRPGGAADAGPVLPGRLQRLLLRAGPPPGAGAAVTPRLGTETRPRTATAVAERLLRHTAQALPDTGGPEPGRAVLDWTGPVTTDLPDERAVQAACGVMHVHGRATGGPAPLAVDYASAAAGALAALGATALRVGRARGLDLSEVRTSVAQGAMLAVGQYLAAATADGGSGPPDPDPPQPPPDSAGRAAEGLATLVACDGTRVEIETLDPFAWREFWARLGA